MNRADGFFKSVESVMDGLLAQKYIVDRRIATTVFLAGNLEKPLLIEGPAGVGKTGLAGAMAAARQTELIRLQCYPGLDECKTIYEWNYQKQLLHIQMQGSECDVYSQDFLLERPLLKAFRATRPVVLLVDEIDKSEEELESFLLEALSEFQVSIPELGLIRAMHKPYVVITSNSTRELGDALKRRCLYLYLTYPDAAREETILDLKVPGLPHHLAGQITAFVQRLRKMKLKKSPSITETIDWARTLLLLGRDSLDEQMVRHTLNVLLKYEEDIEQSDRQAGSLLSSVTDSGSAAGGTYLSGHDKQPKPGGISAAENAAPNNAGRINSAGGAPGTTAQGKGGPGQAYDDPVAARFDF
ncbi:AAA family ATPase [Desulfoscipio gibsoniae]|uniref:MoxR-like ATPase n=1 Tax=Desulfoscipio gibsoniae DSM 7213 TaxID=767817 RepID=R4KLU6_9FIRM|nr:MoxR family ATPase [Desulfoscipio gibsoniae]AGL01500.1 MoxR-like ATPase [Desulfoscipio gibsoniae DSM 7213]